ncbi:MAG: hypothetical protein O2905_00585 [Proteobacteria bacterium]|nr:hypothetical protein [Pseudomonadota bacterium]
MGRALLLAFLFAAVAAGAAAAQDPVRITRLTHIYGIAPDPDDPSAILAASERGIFRVTADSMAAPVSADQTAVSAFAAAGSIGLFFANLAPDADGGPENAATRGMRVSIDAGRTWTVVAAVGAPSEPFLALHGSAANYSRLVGVAGNVFHSEDGGQSWIDAGPPPATVVDIAADPGDAHAIWLGTTAGLFRSSDDGESWAPANHLTGPSAVTLVEFAPDGTLFAFLPGVGLLAAPDAVGGPRAWTQVAPAAAFDGALIHLTVAAGGVAYAVTQFMKIVVSRDGGRSWAPFAR